MEKVVRFFLVVLLSQNLLVCDGHHCKLGDKSCPSTSSITIEPSVSDLVVQEKIKNEPSLDSSNASTESAKMKISRLPIGDTLVKTATMAVHRNNNLTIVKSPTYLLKTPNSELISPKINIRYQTQDNVPQIIKIKRKDVVITPSTVKIEPDVINIHPPPVKYTTPVINIQQPSISIPQQKINVGPIKINSPPPTLNTSQQEVVYDMGQINIPPQVIKVPKPIIQYEESEGIVDAKIKVPPSRINVHLPNVKVSPPVIKVKPPTFYIEERENRGEGIPTYYVEGNKESASGLNENDDISIIQNVTFNHPYPFTGNGNYAYPAPLHYAPGPMLAPSGSTTSGTYNFQAQSINSNAQNAASALSATNNNYVSDSFNRQTSEVNKRFPGLPSPIYAHPDMVLYPIKHVDLTAPQVPPLLLHSISPKKNCITTHQPAVSNSQMSTASAEKEPAHAVIFVDILPPKNEGNIPLSEDKKAVGSVPAISEAHNEKTIKITS